MPKSYSSHELIRLATERGWVLDRIRGSHHIFKHPAIPGIVNIPHPVKDLPYGTARDTLRKIGL